jgi:hypothetical protein
VPGFHPLATPGGALKAAPGAPRSYHLALAGALGGTVVLSDADDQPQEQAYVSDPAFTWGVPTTFNTILLVEPAR